jgi:anti-anti-sigma regulatory factor
MLRITEINKHKKKVVLRIEGKITEPCLWDLEKLCSHYIHKTEKQVVLDFQGVTFIDRKGLSMLEKFKVNRLEIINCSPFIRSLLSNLIICKD